MGELILFASVASSGWVLLHLSGPVIAQKIRLSSRDGRRDDAQL